MEGAEKGRDVLRPTASSAVDKKFLFPLNMCCADLCVDKNDSRDCLASLLVQSGEVSSFLRQ